MKRLLIGLIIIFVGCNSPTQTSTEKETGKIQKNITTVVEALNEDWNIRVRPTLVQASNKQGYVKRYIYIGSTTIDGEIVRIVSHHRGFKYADECVNELLYRINQIENKD